MKIETVEQLEALPDDSVILDADGIVMQHHGVLVDHDGAQERAWMSPPGALRAESEVRLPATLLVPAVVTDEMIDGASEVFEDSWNTGVERLLPNEEPDPADFIRACMKAALEAALGGGS